MAEMETLQPEESDPSEAESMQENEVHDEDKDMPDLEQSTPEEGPSEDLSMFQSDEDLGSLVEKLVDESKDVDVEAQVDPAENLAAEMVEEIEAEMESQLEAEEAEIEEEPLVEPVEEIDDDRRWYVVHCYSGYENKVRHNLEQRIETMGMKDRIFDVVVPTEEEIEVKDGKRKTVERRVFPGYILVQMIMTEESWYVVRNTPGVTGFVGMGNEPTPLRPEEVSSIIKRMEAEAPRIKVTYKIGQKVRIIDGPFNDFIGTVDDIDMEKAKVRVMVSFFGRETPVELDFLQVEKA
jgi:transcriptional antiterminator NusG